MPPGRPPETEARAALKAAGKGFILVYRHEGKLSASRQSAWREVMHGNYLAPMLPDGAEALLVIRDVPWAKLVEEGSKVCAIVDKSQIPVN